MGEVVEIIRNPEHDAIEYIVLKINDLLGQEVRFFAIPVSLSIIKISKRGEITLLANKEDLHLACATTPGRGQQPNHHLNPLIFELINYSKPEQTSRENTNKPGILNGGKQSIKNAQHKKFEEESPENSGKN
ncbi:hypothetical protein [Rhodohalobacter sp. SW132]|uniref:hypothetical protein n=1 Tax=Rhodohalobacter sp. SW132 TaxID=2293433 RepID=UPI0011C072F3|nr:hypothetical protein [Rhodohalobacter sp. SW132]